MAGQLSRCATGKPAQRLRAGGFAWLLAAMVIAVCVERLPVACQARESHEEKSGSTRYLDR